MDVTAVCHHLIARNVNHQNGQITNITSPEFVAPSFRQVFYLSLNALVDGRTGVFAVSFLIEPADQVRCDLWERMRLIGKWLADSQFVGRRIDGFLFEKLFQQAVSLVKQRFSSFGQMNHGGRVGKNGKHGRLRPR